MSPQVSIIVPVYNVFEYVEYTVNSILKQSFTDFELILVNDGSKDNSLEVLRNFESIDSRVRVIDQFNKGVSVARNVGIDVARGEFLQFVDGDDYIEGNMTSELLTEALTENYDVVASSITIRNEKKEEVGRLGVRKEGSYLGGVNALRDYLNGKLFRPTIYNKLYKRRFIDTHKIRFFPNLGMGEDALFVSQVLLKASSISLIDRAHYNYFRNNYSVTNNFREKYFEDIYLLCSETRKLLEEQGVISETKDALDKYAAGKWAYLLKMIIKIDPTPSNFMQVIQLALPQEWKKIPFKYKMLTRIGLWFPKLPNYFVSKP